jgi:hypothetical protein
MDKAYLVCCTKNLEKVVHLKDANKSTLDYQIVVGLRLFINQIIFENVDEKK